MWFTWLRSQPYSTPFLKYMSLANLTLSRTESSQFWTVSWKLEAMLKREIKISFLFYMAGHLVLLAGRASHVLPNQVNFALSSEQLDSYEVWVADYEKWEEQVSLQNRTSLSCLFVCLWWVKAKLQAQNFVCLWKYIALSCLFTWCFVGHDCLGTYRFCIKPVENYLFSPLCVWSQILDHSRWSSNMFLWPVCVRRRGVT